MTIQQHASFDSSAAELNATSKLVKAWESKNAKNAAKAGGISLMALSLAACGGSSTPVAVVDTTPVVDPAVTAAEAAQAAAEAAQATAEAEAAAAAAAQAEAEAAQAEAEAALAAVNAPKNLEFTASATADNLIGGVGNDVITATAGTLAATDRITDTSTTDSDTLTITHSTAPGAFTSSNIETIDVTLNNLGALAVDAANFTGVTQLSVTRGDVVVGGATLTGDKTVSVTNVDASGVAAITVGAGTTTVNIDSAATDKAGHVLNADLATGAITVDGAATINAALSTDVRIDAVTNTAVAETGKASTINAATATRVDTDAALTGAITINAAKAAAVNVNDAQGGVTINAATAHATDATITVVDVDSSGATITVGTGVDDATTAANIAIDIVIDGTAASTDAATISGAGHIELDIDGANDGNVDIITLSGNGAAVVYDLAAPNTGTAVSFTKAGTHSVEIMGDASEFSAITVTDIDVVDIISGGGANFDGSLFSNVGKIDLGVAIGNFVATVVSGSTVEITADQTTKTDFDFSAAGGGDLTIIAGDDNGASAAVGTINLTALNAAAAAATTVGTVTIEASIANVDATGVTLGLKQNLVITGDEDVNLSDTGGTESVIADSVNASGSSGIITINVEDGNVASTADVDSVITGSGADVIEIDVDGATALGVVSVSSGAGNDTITITNASDTSTFDAGAGNDTINADDTTQVVIIGGDGADNFATAIAFAGTIIGGDGSDTITIDADANVTFGATFAFSGIEELDITAVGTKTVSMTGAQLAGNSTLILDGDATTDVFNVNTGSTAAAAKSADLSNVTVKTGATVGITVTGNVGVDTITGGVASETFTQTIGADVYEGGAGTGVDTYVAVRNLQETGSTNASTGTLVNLGTTAVTSAEAIANASSYISGSATSVAGGTAAHLYAANVAGNSAVVDTLGGIENVTGTAGIDYVVGSAENNVISTLGGNDYISAGAGADTVTGGAGNDEILLGASDASADTVVHGTSTAATAQTIGVAGAIAAADTITFGSGVDVVRNFDATMDKIDVTTNGTFASLIGQDEANLDELTTFFVSGAYVEATGVFTIAADGVGADTLIFENEATAANDVLSTMNNGMVLIGVDSDDLSTADLI